MNDEEFPGGQGHGRDGGEKVSVITRLFSQLEESLDSQAPSGDAVEVTPVSPRDRAAALLRRAEKAVSRVDPSLAYAPDRQEAEALAQRYLEAARLEREGGHWGSAGLFAELALEWAARATERGQLFQELQRGEVVEFTVSQNWRGPRAIHVRLVPSPVETSGGTFG